jgi:hypothetical protein
LFKIKVKQEVSVAPLQEYIEELINITEDPTKVVDTSHITTKNKDIKVEATSK